MAVGRITGPLLASNLLRDGVDLSFETDLLYLDVVNGRIGIRQASPQYALDINGDLHALNLFVDTTATIDLLTISSSESSSTISTLLGPINIEPSGLESIYLNSDTTVRGNFHATGNITADGDIVLGDTTSTDTLIIEAEIKSDLLPYTTGTDQISEFSLGSTSTIWKDGLINTIYTRYISPSNTSTDITVFPNPILNSENFPTNTLSINGDIRVYGSSPIGTAPVVTNILYVTMDGDDNNDGRAEDASRACRTISGAVNSPYYKQGTVIKVRSGKYFENNPIQLKPYTCVIGDDLRTTFIQPLNNTLDLFHVNSGVYIAQLTFLNLRKGEVTRYAPGGAGTYTTGAYCVAFPPSLDNPIDVFYSPYIQNCTNQSGPWLYDGTMFVPNQTVQAPAVVGYATYNANVYTLTVTVETGTTQLISIGDAVNGTGILIDSKIPVAVVTDISNPDPDFMIAKALLNLNREFVQAETIAYINQTNPGFVYDQVTCRRDVGLIFDAISHDAILGGLKESSKAGFAYYSGNNILIPGEVSTTTNAISFISSLAQLIVTNSTPSFYYQFDVSQFIDYTLTGGSVAITGIQNSANFIIDIINNGVYIENASSLLTQNRSFIQEEVVAYVDNTYPSLFYDRDLCYRDVGLIIDAVQEDLLHIPSNTESIRAGKAYWVGSTSRISTEISQTVSAINYAKLIVGDIVTNTPVTTIQQSGSSIVEQVINPAFSGGGITVSTLNDLFDTISTIVENGPESAPPSTVCTLDRYLISISTATIASAVNDKLYIGQTSVFPLLDDELPIEWTTSTYADRRINPYGSGGGALVDGNAPSERSPIQSFVFDAFTQITQGGNGIHIINNGYAQLVSVFTIFCDIAVHCETGGICSITNSNSNFGDLCLLAEGHGKREFGGTVVNPAIENYPLGFYPYQQKIEIFVPDPKNRPHIGLLMEVVPPETYINYDGEEVPYVNAQGFPGFLTAAPTTDFLNTGSYTITPIDTLDLAIGHTIYIRDQFGSEYDDFGNRYITTGTTITGISYKTITLSQPIAQGGGEVGNSNYFNIYACGNAYYTVLSSTVAEDVTPNGQSKIAGQEDETVAAIEYLKTLSQAVVINSAITPIQNNRPQIINLSYDGAGTAGFIGANIDIINSIILTGPNNAPPVKKTGTILANAEDAAALLTLNRSFLQDEVIAYVDTTFSPSFTYDKRKCRRDVGLLVDALVADLLTGGNFRAIEAGSTYYSRAGTYHIVSVEDNVRDPLLFVDGISVNFYQRSYMSASGYLFEYVGAGTQYGALPQVGKADPVQSKEVVQLNNGKVFFTSTDQNGDFRIGPGLVISQATGVLSGRTFEKSLFAQMTPFILAVEAGGGE